MSSPTQSKRKSCEDELAAGNILGLSRVLNNQSSRKHQHKRNHTAPISNTAPVYDEQIQLVRLFLQRLQDPLTIIPIVVEMRNNPISYSSGLTRVLLNTMDDWLVSYLALFIEQDTPYRTVLEKKINKLGCIFLKILEKEDEQAALFFVANNLNHLEFIKDSYQNLLSNILEGQCLGEYAVRFAAEGELYFLHTLITIIKMVKIDNAAQLLRSLKDWTRNDRQCLKVCQMSISPFFQERYGQLCSKFKYD